MIKMSTHAATQNPTNNGANSHQIVAPGIKGVNVTRVACVNHSGVTLRYMLQERGTPLPDGQIASAIWSDAVPSGQTYVFDLGPKGFAVGANGFCVCDTTAGPGAPRVTGPAGGSDFSAYFSQYS